jgi:hypothetical protein
VADLEARQSRPYGKAHRLIQRQGQTRDDAMDAYGRHLIGPDDIVIINRIVSPKWDADGNLVRQDPRALVDGSPKA